MQHAQERRETHIKFRLGNLKGIDHLEDVMIDKDNINMDLKK
jgi:hypothetical protein